MPFHLFLFHSALGPYLFPCLCCLYVSLASDVENLAFKLLLAMSATSKAGSGFPYTAFKLCQLPARSRNVAAVVPTLEDPSTQLVRLKT